MAVMRPGTRSTRRACVAGTLILLAAGWLVMTADSSPHQDLFFGLWRTTPFLVAMVLVWLAIAFLLACGGRQRLFRYLFVTGAFAFALICIEVVALLGLVDYGAILGGARHPLGTVAVPHLSE